MVSVNLWWVFLWFLSKVDLSFFFLCLFFIDCLGNSLSLIYRMMWMTPCPQYTEWCVWHIFFIIFLYPNQTIFNLKNKYFIICIHVTAVLPAAYLTQTWLEGVLRLLSPSINHRKCLIVTIVKRWCCVINSIEKGNVFKMSNLAPVL